MTTPSHLLQGFNSVSEAKEALVKLGLNPSEIEIRERTGIKTYGKNWIPKKYKALFHQKTGERLSYTMHYPNGPAQVHLGVEAIKTLKAQNLI